MGHYGFLPRLSVAQRVRHQTSPLLYVLTKYIHWLLQKGNKRPGGRRNIRAQKHPPENYEPVSAEVARSALTGDYLRIENLEKVYDNGFKAVNGLNVKIYQN
jgi:hypothetical protein